MKISLKTKAIFFTALTLLLSVLGVGIATALLRWESFEPDPHRFYGIPIGAFTLLVVLTAMLAASVVVLVWVDYRQHRHDEQAQLLLEEQVARRTEQLLLANEQLQEMDRIKTELIHRVSHELRTPLTSIGGYSEVLMDQKVGPLNGLQEDFLRTIAENTARLRTLVDDILETSRWEAGTQPVTWEPVSLPQIARQAEEALRPILEAREQRWTLDVPSSLPPVWGDAAKLLQMVSNLLGNAAKYTPPKGQVSLAIRAASGRVEILVEDTGVGIPKEFFPRLYDKFERAANVEKPGYSGTGLGLYLVKQIVDAHRGIIRIDSEIGKGTRVAVSLPAQGEAPHAHESPLSLISSDEDSLPLPPEPLVKKKAAG